MAGVAARGNGGAQRCCARTGSESSGGGGDGRRAARGKRGEARGERNAQSLRSFPITTSMPQCLC